LTGEINTVPYHVSKQRFARLVEEALTDLPEPFASHLEEMTVEIQVRPTRKQLKEQGLDDDELLLGLYVGVPMTERHVEAGSGIPDKIFVFQEDIELCCETERELVEQTRITVLHEIGHHFGMSEDDLEELGYR
jgi:predicted Zn-dependent protease with MMP-like domain